MKIQMIGFGYTASLGNYENAKLYLECELEPNDDPDKAIEELKQKCFQVLGKDDEFEFRQLRQEVEQLKGKERGLSYRLETYENAIEQAKEELKQMQQAHKAAKEFLAKHGIAFKPEFPEESLFWLLRESQESNEDEVDDEIPPFKGNDADF